MRNVFTKEFILENKGCYTTEKVLALPCINNDVITLKDLSECLPLSDFYWFAMEVAGFSVTSNESLYRNIVNDFLTEEMNIIVVWLKELNELEESDKQKIINFILNI